MAKIIRPTYPVEFSIGLLLLIFVISSFLSFEIFSVQWHDIMDGGSPIIGMALSGFAVVIMSLILWEEFLFPVRIRPEKDEIVFRNHFTKLKTQVLIYCIIPLIAVAIFLNYKVSYVPFFVWATICILAPLGKLFSGIKNYNDFLKITNNAISYRNNDKHGVFHVRDIKAILPIRDEANVLHKIQVKLADREEVIDLDEMELEAYFQTIDEFIDGHFASLLLKKNEQ